MPPQFEKFDASNETSEFRANFDRQYDNPQSITVEGEKFLIYDIAPEEQKSETPVMFCPGWIEDPVNHKESTYVLYEEGRRVVFPDAPHGISEKRITEKNK